MRPMTTKTKTKIIAATAGAATLALSAGGVAYASTGTPASRATAKAPAAVPARRTPVERFLADHPGLRREIVRTLSHTVHAELVVHTKSGYVTVDVDKGTLTSASTTSLSLQRPDGPSVSAAVTSSTRFFGVPESKLARGDRTLMVQTGGNAVLVLSAPPKTSSSSS